MNDERKPVEASPNGVFTAITVLKNSIKVLEGKIFEEAKRGKEADDLVLALTQGANILRSMKEGMEGALAEICAHQFVGMMMKEIGLEDTPDLSGEDTTAGENVVKLPTGKKLH